VIHAVELPGFGVVEAALRRTTDKLAREVAMPTATPPPWSAFEWQVARAVAAMQGITVLLAHRLRWRGPDSWQDFLDTQRVQAQRRDARLGDLLTQLDVELRAARLSCIGLKGSALRPLGLYRAGERPMGDIDLLAHSADAPRIAHALASMGYALGGETRRHQVFVANGPQHAIVFGEHPRNPIKIEVHFGVSESLPIRPVDITTGLWPSQPHYGINGYASPRELMRHLLLHAAGNMRAHALRQVQLHDIALLSRRLGPAGWQSLVDTPDAEGGTWWMWPVLQQVQHLYPFHLPPYVDLLRSRTTRRLRAAGSRLTLTDVSWSNLRIAAFPGIYWSRSAREALQFVSSRVIPGRRPLDELRVGMALQSDLMRVPWYGLPHARRIATWLFSRPPRVQTLLSIQDALAIGGCTGDPASGAHAEP
jgi:hypothetical protein